jgi:hypothetical protein
MRLWRVCVTTSLIAGSGALALIEGCSSFSGDDEPSPPPEAGSDAPMIPSEAAAEAATEGGTRSLRGVYVVGYGDQADGGSDGGVSAGAFDLVATAAGGAVLTGLYSAGVLDVGGGQTLPYPQSGGDGFLLEVGAQGQGVLSRAFGGEMSQFAVGVAASEPNIRYVGLIFEGVTDMGRGSITSQGPFNSVISRFAGVTNSGDEPALGANGALVFVRRLAAATGGGVLAIGTWDKELKLSTFSSLGSGGPAGFLAKLFPPGGEQSIVRTYCGGTNACYPVALATNEKGHTIVTGRYVGTFNHGDAGSISAVENDAFIARFNAKLDPVWIRAFEGSGAQEGLAVTAVPGSDDFIVAGSFTGTLDVPGQPQATTKGAKDIFLARLDVGGKVMWLRTFGSTGDDKVVAVKADAQGNVFMTGEFTSPSLELGGSALVNADMFGLNTPDIFLGWFDSGTGTHVYSTRFGDGAVQGVGGLGIDGKGDVIIAGSFSGVMDVGTGAITARGAADIFIAKLTR